MICTNPAVSIYFICIYFWCICQLPSNRHRPPTNWPGHAGTFFFPHWFLGAHYFARWAIRAFRLFSPEKNFLLWGAPQVVQEVLETTPSKRKWFSLSPVKPVRSSFFRTTFQDRQWRAWATKDRLPYLTLLWICMRSGLMNTIVSLERLVFSYLITRHSSHSS